MFGLGTIAYVSLLLINSIAVLSHDRFLAPLGLTTDTASASGAGAGGQQVPRTPYEQYDSYAHATAGPGGAQGDGQSIKARAVALVGAVRTLMRSTSSRTPPAVFLTSVLTSLLPQSPFDTHQHRLHRLRAALWMISRRTGAKDHDARRRVDLEGRFGAHDASNKQELMRKARHQECQGTIALPASSSGLAERVSRERRIPPVQVCAHLPSTSS